MRTALSSSKCAGSWRHCGMAHRTRASLKCLTAYSSATVRQAGEDGASEAQISSTSNTFVKHCLRLRTSSSYRSEQKTVLVVGLTPILELANEVRELDIRTLLWASKDQRIPTGLKPGRVVSVTMPVIRKISGVQSAEGLTAAAEIVMPETSTDFCSPRHSSFKRLLVLDGVQDPGNLGTLLRTALALGWQGAFLLPGCCDPFNDKAMRAGRGAAFKIPLACGEWSQLESILSLRQMVALGAQPASVEEGCEGRPSSGDGALEGIRAARIALVLGSEGQGLSKASQERCRAVTVPMTQLMESLSVSQAGAILLFVLSSGLPDLIRDLDAACRQNG